MSDILEAPPLFDRSQKALAFALNHSRLMYAQPLMTKAANVLDSTKGEPNRRRNPDLAGLDGSGQAGMILLQLRKLMDCQIHALVSRVAHPSFPCSCRQPCCMGVKPNPDWVDAIKFVTEFAKEAAQPQPEQPGKKRTHVNPLLRRMLVEKYFGRRYVLADLAEKFGISEATVTNHRKPIVEILTELEKSGWTELDGYLTDAGIVGAME